MISTFFEQVKKMVDFEEEELKRLFSKMEIGFAKKGDFILEAGKPSNNVYFLISGLTKYYIDLPDGREMILAFVPEKNWISAYPEFLHQKMSNSSIKAIEDSHFLTLSYQNMQELYKGNKQFEKFGRHIAEYLLVMIMQNNEALMTKTPETRYLELMKSNPSLFERVSLNQIASYLGIAPESLSRIRKRLSKS
jgi:CRP-like cAMP-binding protein